MATRKTTAPRAPRRAATVPAFDATGTLPPGAEFDSELNAYVEPAMMPPPLRSTVEDRREEQLESILAQIGDADLRIGVYHVVDGKATFAGHMVGEFSLDVLLDTFGGGDKQLRVYQGAEHKGTFTVSLDPSVPNTSPRARAAEAARRAAITAPGGGPAVDPSFNNLVLTLLTNSQKQTEALMTALVGTVTANKQAAPAVDPSEYFIKAVDAVMKLQPKENPGSGPGGFADLLAIMDRGIAIGKSVGGNGDDASVTGVIGKGLEAVTEILRTAQKSRANDAPPAGTRVAMVPAPELPSTTQHASPTDATNDVAAHMTPLHTQPPVDPSTLRPWVRKARPLIAGIPMLGPWITNVSPSTVADMVNDKLDELEYDDLMSDIGTTDESLAAFAGRLNTYFPELMPHVTAEWLGGIVQAFFEMESDEHEDAETSNNAGSQLLSPPASGVGT